MTPGPGGAARALGLALLLAAGAGCAHVAPAPPPPADWIAHDVCGPDTRPGRGERFCVKVVELGEAPRRVRGVALLVPGMFQNVRSWDLLPEKGISFARFLVSRGLKVYLLQVRGLGGSDLPPGSTLDDLAIEDIPRAIAWVADREGQKVILFGQSQGSITSQAALAGLTRCGGRDCFDPEVARARQARVRSVGLFTGNLALTGVHPVFRAASELGYGFRGLLALFTDRLPGRTLAVLGVHTFGPRSMWYLHLSPKVQGWAVEAMAERSVEATTVGMGAQLAQGVLTGGVTSGGERWARHLGNITVPVIQTTFSDDPLAPPLETYRDDFRFIGSAKKKFKRVRGQRHEDWMMSAELHAQHWLTVEELIEGW